MDEVQQILKILFDVAITNKKMKIEIKKGRREFRRKIE